MELELLSTKLYIPPTRAKLVARKHLLDKLISGVNDKLTLVSAPAGFGKTTLISEWVTSSDRPGVWLSLDQGDNELNRFLSYLIVALQRIEPIIGVGIKETLESTHGFSREALITDLINDITQVNEPFILVLDDYHTITHADVHNVVTYFLENLPPQIHIVIASRSDPPWPMARLRARCEMNEIRADDLRFTTDECTQFITDVMGIELSESELKEIERRTEGWIAGLQMAALSMHNRGNVSGYIRSFTSSHRFILDYLVEEVLNQQSPEVQNFLLKTSILERLTEPLCDVLTGGDSDTDMLLELDRANLFLIHLDDERCWYRYHQLFADLLRGKLEKDWPEQIPVLHMKASQWYKDQGLVEEAIQHAFKAGELDVAADLVETFAMEVINQSKIRTLSDWIGQLPEKLINHRPMLCIYLAWTRYCMGERDTVEDCLAIAERCLLETSITNDRGKKDKTIIVNDHQYIQGYIAVIRAFCAIQAEDTQRIQEMSNKAIDQLPDGNYMRALASLALAAAYWGLGSAEESEIFLRQTVSMARRGGYRNLEISGLVNVGIQQAKKARLFDAMNTYEEAMIVGSWVKGSQLPFTCFPSIKIGDVYREWNDLERAETYIFEGKKRSYQLGHSDVIADAYVAISRLQLAKKELEQASDSISKLVKLVESTKLAPWVGAWLNDCRLSLWFASDELEKAQEWVNESGLQITDRINYLDNLNLINLARVLVAQGLAFSDRKSFQDADFLLARLLEAAQEAGWVEDVIRILVLQSISYHANIRQNEAVDLLLEALKYAEAGRYVRVFIDHGTAIRSVLLKASLQRKNDEYLRFILMTLESEINGKQKNLPPISKQAQSLLLIEPLSDRELQVLKMLTTELSVPEIAGELVIGVSTVRTHVKNIYGKLGVHNRYRAVAISREIGLI